VASQGRSAGAGACVRALLEILLAIAGIATAVVIFPIVKRVNESIALGYIAARTVESILILVGVLSLMSVVALRQNLAATGSTEGPLIDVGRALVALHEQTRLLVRSSVPGSGMGFFWAT
jgi:Domain of unknown function (DUF4386)